MNRIDYFQPINTKKNLAISYSKLEEIYSELGNLDLALEYYQKFTDLMKEIYAQNPKNVNLYSDLGISFAKHGRIYLKLKQSKLSKENYKNAIEIYDNIYKMTKLPRFKEWKENIEKTISKFV